MEPILYQPIGIIHSPLKSAKGSPIQSIGAVGISAVVEVFPDYVSGLADLEGFSHILLLYHFHKISEVRLMVKPFLDNVARGVFSTRAPARPNAIGLSLVRLREISGGNLMVDDVDILDGAPLLDIKPFVPEFDCRSGVRRGWLEGKVGAAPQKSDDGRFVDLGN